MSRIRHATETFVNNLIEGIKKLIASNTEQINVLSNTKSEYIGKAFISEEILLDAAYPIAYCGSVNNSSTMPNTGQFRVQYIPYFANNEGYSVQIAWGVVTNSGLWYRVASGTRWEKWENFSTTTKTDISFPYASNYNDFGTTDASTVTKVNNQVIVTMNTCKKDGESFTSGEIIGTLPVGYRPTSHTRSSGMSTNSVPILIEVFTTGNIRIKHAGATNITQITGEVIFYV